MMPVGYRASMSPKCMSRGLFVVGLVLITSRVFGSSPFLILDDYLILPLASDELAEYRDFWRILADGDDRMVNRTWSIRSGEKWVFVDLYLRISPAAGIDQAELSKRMALPVLRVKEVSSGIPKEVLESWTAKIRRIETINGLAMRKFVSDWPTESSTDVLSYDFSLDASRGLFDWCMVKFSNIWGSLRQVDPLLKAPLQTLNPAVIETYPNQADPRIVLYKSIDAAMQSVILGEPFATPAKGVVNADGLRMRDVPSLGGQILANLGKGQSVEVQGRTDRTQMIGAAESVWYRVRTPEGKEGWVYGAFLDIDKGDAQK